MTCRGRPAWPPYHRSLETRNGKGGGRAGPPLRVNCPRSACSASDFAADEVSWFQSFTVSCFEGDPMRRVLWTSLFAIAITMLGVVVSANGPGDARKAIVTFNKDVAPIFFNNCVQCHRPGEIAPMSLLTYKDARHLC